MELKLIAVLAMMGLSRSPKNGLKNLGGYGDAQHVVDKCEKQILPDVAHDLPAQMNCFDDC
jgi:hypothetical protein